MPFGYDIYFSERARNRVVRWSPDTGDVEIVAGEPKDGHTNQKLSQPYGLAFDRDGHLLIADKHNNRICRLLKGKLEAIALRDVHGHRAPRDDSYPGYDPALHCPTGLCVEPDGSIVCTFSEDYVIYRIRPKGELELLLGIPRNRPYHFSGTREIVPPAGVLDTPLNVPTGIIDHPDGSFFFIERKPQLVREFHPARGLRSVFPVSRKLESSRSRKAPDEARLSDFHPAWPAALALDSHQRLHVCDIWHGCIFRVEPASDRVLKVLQIPDSLGPNMLGPIALAFGPDGTAWVFDTVRAAVVAYSPTPRGQWKETGVRLSDIRGQSLRQLSCAGSALVVGQAHVTGPLTRSNAGR